LGQLAAHSYLPVGLEKKVLDSKDDFVRALKEDVAGRAAEGLADRGDTGTILQFLEGFAGVAGGCRKDFGLDIFAHGVVVKRER
jgi:hypothetical protein